MLRPKTFENIKTLLEEIKICKRKTPPICLVASDLEFSDTRLISYHQGKTLATETGSTYFECQSRFGTNVDHVLCDVLKQIRTPPVLPSRPKRPLPVCNS